MHDVDRMRLETGMDEFGEAEYEEEYGDGEFEGALDEVGEMELATELLELGDEAEWEEFLGRLLRRARSRTGRALRSGVGRALAGVLRGVVRQAAPAGRPSGAGATWPQLGLELEGLSAEEQEFEVARNVVRLAADAADEAAELQETRHPVEAARIAVDRAARRYAPGLANTDGTRGDGPYLQRRRSGRWVRRGRSIVLLDI